MNKLLKLAIVMMMAGLASCNTWEGIKEDSHGVGDAVNEAADNVKEGIHKATE